MGADARKQNNARSTTLFNEANAIAQKPYSDEETSNIRSRALSPITSAYARSGEEMRRSALLSGGAPNLIASLAKNTRDRSSALSDATTNVNAGIAQNNLQGKLAGINAASGVRPVEGFGWGKLFGALGNIIPAASGAFKGKSKNSQP